MVDKPTSSHDVAPHHPIQQHPIQQHPMQHHPMQRVHIKTYGCQMNVYDSVRMADVLSSLNYTEHAEVEGADLIILNTCHIREKAAEKVYSELGRIRKYKRQQAAQGHQVMIAVAGCVAQAEGEEIIKRAPYVDMVIGSQSYHHLPRLVQEARRAPVVALDFPDIQKFDLLPEQTRGQGRAAFVSIQEGCDKFCTFCVVPYTRGAEYSRPVGVVEREVRQLVELHGAVEITLLGQNVNAYHGANEAGGTASLAQLIERLASISGLERIRYTTSHPCDMRDDLVQAHKHIPQLMPFMHLPVQSGSDRILKAMNRKHTAADYLHWIESLRTARPDIAFSSDFIVGFPGESDADFQDTLRLVESVGYASAYSFTYSPRPGTPAAERAEHVDTAVKTARLAELQALLNKQQQHFNSSTVGRTMDVLLERPGKLDGQVIGRSPYMQSVHVANSAALMGHMVQVRITEAFANSVSGTICAYEQVA